MKLTWRLASLFSVIAFGFGLLAGFIAFGDHGDEPECEALWEASSGGESGDASAPPPSPLPPEIALIALDAGHGGTDTGATYPADAGTRTGLLFEKDLNLAVIYELKSLLEDDSDFEVVLTREVDEFIFARERADRALQECESQFGRECDLFLSVHHNGFEDSAYDGPLVIYDEEEDLTLASSLHKHLLSGLAFPPEGCSYGYFFTDYGLAQDDFGLPVHEGLVSATTEAYYVTNDCEADHHLSGTGSSKICEDDSNCRTVTLGTRVQDEARALYEGIVEYYTSASIPDSSSE